MSGWGRGGAAILALCCACAHGGGGRSDSDGGRDAGPGVDGGPGFDSGPGLDAGPGVDAGTDAGDLDAGVDAGPCDESPCRLVSPQCGCVPGQGCYVDGEGTRMCAEAGDVAANVRCSGLTACQPGHACVGSDGVSWCHPFCEDDADCTGPGSLCILTIGDGMGGSLPGIVMCTVSCDPVTPGADCPTGTGCSVYQDSASSRFLTHCRSTGGGGQGATCTDDSDCMAGYGCVGPTGGPLTCRHWCRVATGEGCTGGTTCSSLGTAAIIDGTEYGVCS